MGVTSHSDNTRNTYSDAVGMLKKNTLPMKRQPLRQLASLRCIPMQFWMISPDMQLQFIHVIEH